MINKIYKILAKKYTVIFIMIIATILSYFDRNYGYFFGLGIVFLILKGTNFKWSEFGLVKKINKKTIFKSLLFAIVIFIGIDIFIQPFLEIYFGPIDLSSVDDIRGDFINYVILMIIMWVFAAFGEELLFSGYYMKQIAKILGDTNRAWILSVFIISIYFGISHNYQDTSGMIAVGLASFCSFMIFAKNRDNLILVILIHGFYDTIGLTLIYLNKDRIFFDWIQQML